MRRWLTCALAFSMAGTSVQAMGLDDTAPQEQPYRENGASNRACAGARENPNAAYPFDVKRLQKALDHSDFQQRATVAVVDNGFAGYGYVEGALAPTRTFPKPFFRDTDGKWLQESWLVKLPLSKTNRWDEGHGTHVTGLVLGGPYGGGTPSDDDLGIPGVRKLLFQDGRTKIGPGQPKPYSTINVAIISVAENFVDLNKNNLANVSSALILLKFTPNIINMSLVHTPTDEEVEAYRVLPSSFPDSLLVVSAGNARKVLTSGVGGQYPAMSNRGAGNLLVVGSHDSDMKKSSFSNFHDERVTIAAPGCAIASWLGDDDDPEEASGTSQAAAIVTFAAALVRSRWNVKHPSQLRDRLIASSRYSEFLAEKCEYQEDDATRYDACVRWGSALDIEAALYYDTDLVEYCEKASALATEGCKTKLAIGKLQGLPEGFLKCQRNPIDLVKESDVKGLTLSSGMRVMRGGRYQILYRRYEVGDTGQTLERCDTVAITSGSVTLARHEMQPDPPASLDLDDGAPLVLPITRVVRIVSRSQNSAR